MIANVCVTGSAERYVSSPGCVAVIVHEPTLVMWTVVPDTEHAPDPEKLTGSPDVAVAAMVKSGSPYVRSGSGAKSICCASFIHVLNVRSRGVGGNPLPMIVHVSPALAEPTRLPSGYAAAVVLKLAA